MNKPDTPTLSFVSLAEAARRSSLSRGTVYNEIKRGLLPKPVSMSPNRVALPADAVERWLAAKLQEAAAA